MMIDISLLQVFLMQIASQSNSCSSGIQGCFTATYTAWFSVAGVAALAVLAVLAFIYAVCQFVGRSDIKAWTRVKIYDVALSLILILAFIIASGLIYNFNVSGLQSIQLVPSGCTNSTASANVYSLAICDMYTFNVFTANLTNAQYYFTLAAGALQPTYMLNWEIPVGVPGGQALASIGVQGIVSLIPKDTGFKYLSIAIDLMYGFILANDVQLIMLSASALIFAILMSLGLIARIFGVTRTFGGAMIAFALGLGLVYPMLVCINYGFIDYGLSQVQPLALGNAVNGSLFWFAPSLVTTYTGSSILGLLARGYAVYNTASGTLPEPIFIYVGLLWIGLTFIPLINLVIVDVFIVDFSQAIGERMDLLSMLERIL